MLRTRVLTSGDLPVVLRLKEQAGWNQTPADLARFLHLEPEGCFLAEWEGAPVGTACGFLFGPVAWIAMVLVDNAHRGRGIGRELMNLVLEYVDGRGAETVRLDATALGRPLYETLGFTTQFTLTRYHAPWGRPPACQDSLITSTAGQRPAPRVEPLSAERLDQVVDLDHRITRTDRDRLIRRLYTESPDEFRIACHEERICGYVTSRPGSRARQIGPCIATEDSGPMLLADAIDRAAGQDIFIDLPATHPTANVWLTARGFAPQRELFRMCRGAPLLEEINHLWASSGPEKG
jgi:GNAT superfamily N-acetyltransferase